MSIPKVALVEADTSFQCYNKAKEKFYVYTYNLYKNLINLDMQIATINIKISPILGKGISIMLDSIKRDFSMYDIIHNLDLNPFFPLRKGKAITINTVHDIAFVLDKNSIKEDIHSIRHIIWSNFVTKLGLYSTLNADYLIAVSTLTKEDLISLGYDRNRIFVVNHGIDERFLAPTRSYPNKKFIVGYLGVLAVRKNPRFLIEAFKALKDTNTELHVWGKPGYSMQKIIQDANKIKNIKFKGFAPEDKKVEIYDSFDVFVFPSLYEGFGIPIIEAQSRGLPVIIYKYGKIPKEVRRYCLEAESPEHMVQIIEDLKENGYNEKERKKAMEYARSFTWERTAKETLEAYRKL